MSSLIVQRSIGTPDLTVTRRLGLVEGMAVPWDTPALVSDDGRTTYQEAWSRESFRAQRLDLRPNAGRVIFVANQSLDTHDENDRLNWIGRSVVYRESDEGLVGQWQVNRDDEFALAALDAIDQGCGLSICADIFDTVTRSEVALRTRARLIHVAAVGSPAYGGARVQAVRQQRTPRRDALADWLAQQRR